MCLVEIPNLPKPIISCAFPINPGISINTESPLVFKGRENISEFLLANHPIDCPICDQGGECDLQDITFNHGNSSSRFFFNKSTKSSTKFSDIVSTSMNKCINCTKCIRLGYFLGFNQLGLFSRSGHSSIKNFSKKERKLFSLKSNLIGICPVSLELLRDFYLKNYFLIVLLTFSLSYLVAFLLDYKLFFSLSLLYIYKILNKGESIPKNFYIKLLIGFIHLVLALASGNFVFLAFFLYCNFIETVDLSRVSVIKDILNLFGEVVQNPQVQRIIQHPKFVPGVSTTFGLSGLNSYIHTNRLNQKWREFESYRYKLDEYRHNIEQLEKKGLPLEPLATFKLDNLKSSTDTAFEEYHQVTSPFQDVIELGSKPASLAIEIFKG